MLSPKETGNTGSTGAYPFDVEYSALLESGFSSTGSVAVDATLAVCFKPLVVDTSKDLCDPTNHYLLTIQKQGAGVRVWKQGVELTNYTGTIGTTYAEFLQNVLTEYAGSSKGYYSNLHIVDGAVLDYTAFYETAATRQELWVCKKSPDVNYGTCGGHYPFSVGSISVGANIFTGGTASASSTYDATHVADLAFDGGLTESSGWASASGFPCWLQYQLPEAKTLRFYTIHPYPSGGYAPDCWEIQGSNDGATWTTIHEVVNEAWSPSVKTYEVTTPGSYLYYRMLITSALTQSRTDVVEWLGYESGTPFALGTDFSGNKNHWTITGAQTTDTPTNNQITINPLNSAGGTTSNGNRIWTVRTGGHAARATLALPENGKWYCEYTITGPAFGYGVGVMDADERPNQYARGWRGYKTSGHKYSGAISSLVTYGATYTVGDVIGVAADMDAGTLAFYKNGVSQGVAHTDLAGKRWYLSAHCYSIGGVISCAFNEDSFVHTPPANFLALSARNLPEPAVFSEHMTSFGLTAQAGVDHTVAAGWNLENDKWMLFLTAKTGEYFRWFDSVRGGDKSWTMTTAVEVTEPTVITVSGNVMTIPDGMLADGVEYIGFIFRAGSQFDVVRVNHTTGTDTVFDHGLGSTPNRLLLHGAEATPGGPYAYHPFNGVDGYLPQWAGSPLTAAPGFWSPLNTTQASIDASLPTGAYVIYLFGGEMGVATEYARSGAANIPFVNLDGNMTYAWLNVFGAAGQGIHLDEYRNPATPWAAFKYLNGYTGDGAGASIVPFSTGFLFSNTFFNESSVASPDVIVWGILKQPFKYSNAV